MSLLVRETIASETSILNDTTAMRNSIENLTQSNATGSRNVENITEANLTDSISGRISSLRGNCTVCQQNSISVQKYLSLLSHHIYIAQHFTIQRHCLGSPVSLCLVSLDVFSLFSLCLASGIERDNITKFFITTFCLILIIPTPSLSYQLLIMGFSDKTPGTHCWDTAGLWTSSTSMR